MKISVTAAKGQLADLVRRAQRGEEVVLTRHGKPAARLVAAGPAADPRRRRSILDSARKAGAESGMQGVDAAHSQDFLYEEAGLPG